MAELVVQDGGVTTALCTASLAVLAGKSAADAAEAAGLSPWLDRPDTAERVAAGERSARLDALLRTTALWQTWPDAWHALRARSTADVTLDTGAVLDAEDAVDTLDAQEVERAFAPLARAIQRAQNAADAPTARAARLCMPAHGLAALGHPDPHGVGDADAARARLTALLEATADAGAHALDWLAVPLRPGSRKRLTLNNAQDTRRVLRPVLLEDRGSPAAMRALAAAASSEAATYQARALKGVRVPRALSGHVWSAHHKTVRVGLSHAGRGPDALAHLEGRLLAQVLACVPAETHGYAAEDHAAVIARALAGLLFGASALRARLDMDKTAAAQTARAMLALRVLRVRTDAAGALALLDGAGDLRADGLGTTNAGEAALDAACGHFEAALGAPVGPGLAADLLGPLTVGGLRVRSAVATRAAAAFAGLSGLRLGLLWQDLFDVTAPSHPALYGQLLAGPGGQPAWATGITEPFALFGADPALEPASIAPLLRAVFERAG